MTSYGADFTVEVLVNQLRSGDIFVPSFQRNFIWTYKQSSKFIESLLLGLPVPGIFLSKEYPSEKLLIVDGQQRLKTLQFYYDGVFPNPNRLFSLKYVQDKFSTLSYKRLQDDDRRRLNNSVIHATIVKQDQPIEKTSSSIYYLFERLNTGGSVLHPQEIRACIYHGKLNDLLNELNSNISWRHIFGQKHKRLRDIELILRYFALLDDYNLYKEPMMGFLNDFMATHRNPDNKRISEYSTKFTNTISLVDISIGKEAFRIGNAINAAILESVLIGITKRMEKGGIKEPAKIRELYLKLMQNRDYVDSVIRTTGNVNNVKNRINIAIKTFDDLQ